MRITAASILTVFSIRLSKPVTKNPLLAAVLVVVTVVRDVGCSGNTVDGTAGGY